MRATREEENFIGNEQAIFLEVAQTIKMKATMNCGFTYRHTKEERKSENNTDMLNMIKSQKERVL